MIDVISGSQREIPESERDASTPETHSQQKHDDTKGRRHLDDVMLAIEK